MNSGSSHITIPRKDWAQLYDQRVLSITPEHFEQLKGVNDQITIDELSDVYLPLAEFIHIQVTAAQQLQKQERAFLKQPDEKTPYIIGIAGSVAAGKSTTARLLQTLLSEYDNHPHVDIVTTDGFLYPNQVLQDRGIMHKKGFPQSYDIRKLIQFLSDVKAGAPEVSAPIYSHLVYDIVQDQMQTVRNPDILIVEGINVLQVSRAASVFVSDFFDYSIFVDADEAELEQWYLERFLILRGTAFQNASSYFHRYSDLTEDEAIAFAKNIWKDINQINLIDNILPTKARAKMILVKGSQHKVQSIHIRK